MPDLLKQGPPDEQTICVTCGFCCDGTLFLHAHLNPGERGVGDLPEWIEENSFDEGGKDFFRLPCHYFSEKCTIYDRKRAYVCGSYRCQLLKDFADGKVTLDDAQKTVTEAMRLRAEIIEEYHRVSSDKRDINFRELLIKLVKIVKAASDKEPVGLDYDLLLVRCNIFEALLIKNFRSAEDFEKMIMK